MVIWALLVLTLAAPSSAPARFSAPVWDANDRTTIAEPKERRVAQAYDFLAGTFSQPAAQLFDMPRNFRKIAGRPKEAEDVNAVDEVPNSSWFSNRNFFQPLTAAEIQRGPGDSNGPASGPWTITKCKSDGISPGLEIQDASKQSYILKFDPEDYPELASAADVIGSRLFFAAGYNVPSNSVVVFERSRLVPKEDLVCTDYQGKKFPLADGGLDHMLETAARTKDGRYRAMASKYLDGKPKGPFSYLGVRDDDPNDKIAHEYRRELRGLKVIASFINHTDIKQINTLDTYVEEDGHKFLKHHFIDFGASLGSATDEPKSGMEGNEYIFDTGEVLKSAFSLGLYRRSGDHHVENVSPSIGYLEGSKFEPRRWKSNYPIAAFENMTDRDAYWGAKIVASFTDDQIAAAVHTGAYSDPDAEKMLTEILKQRRDRIADYWFRKAAPLDRFKMDGNRLTFDDLAVLARRDQPENVHYDVVVRSDKSAKAVTKVNAGAPITIEVTDEPTEARITRSSKGWPDLTVTVYVQRVDGIPSVVGIQR